MMDKKEYFMKNIEDLSGSFILILAVFVGVCLGWFLRGLRSKGNNDQEVPYAIKWPKL